MTSESKLKYLICWFLFFVGVGLDLWTKKIYFLKNFDFGFIYISPLKNFGLISGIDFGYYTNLFLLIIFLVVLIVYFFRQQKSMSLVQTIGMSLIFSGAMANLFDRFMFGFVRDWLSVGLNFSFNLADVWIVVGIIMFFLKNNQDKNLEGA